MYDTRLTESLLHKVLFHFSPFRNKYSFRLKIFDINIIQAILNFLSFIIHITRRKFIMKVKNTNV